LEPIASSAKASQRLTSMPRQLRIHPDQSESI
jgi:hypothetical protein